ncbi:hypothetical protein [Priestia megaterium]
MEQYYIIGAQQKTDILKDWEQYKKGIILKISPENNSVEKCIEYTSPPEVCSKENPSVSFTAGTLSNKHLYVGTHTEVLVYSLPDFHKVGYISLPCFNEIHHVCPTSEGNLLVVNTGLDTILEITAQGEILNEWHVMGENVWEYFSQDVDYRKVPTTKPHKSHPNYVFKLGDDVWATRCLQKDAICLTNPSKKINIGRQLVHDGVVVEELIYFTQVDGYIVVVDIHTLEVVKVYNLKEMTDTDIPLGWCRGIKVLNANKVIVGFTRIRPTKKVGSDGKVYWKGEYGILPTRIACYDLKLGIILWEQRLEDYDMNAIYSIHMVNE